MAAKRLVEYSGHDIAQALNPVDANTRSRNEQTMAAGPNSLAAVPSGFTLGHESEGRP